MKVNTFCHSIHIFIFVYLKYENIMKFHHNGVSEVYTIYSCKILGYMNGKTDVSIFGKLATQSKSIRDSAVFWCHLITVYSALQLNHHPSIFPCLQAPSQIMLYPVPSYCGVLLYFYIILEIWMNTYLTIPIGYIWNE